MPNLSPIIPNTTKALALSDLVLVTPETPTSYQPQNPLTDDGQVSDAALPPKLLFNTEGENISDIQSDITDHYVEDNYAIQDMIALKPEEYTVTGFIGELNDIIPSLPGDISPKFIADKLTAVGAFVPGVSSTVSAEYAKAQGNYQAARKIGRAAVSAWSTAKNLLTGGTDQATIGATGLIEGSGVQNRQQTAYQQFYGYWRARTLFSVQTPWALFQNMAIKSMRAVQNPETNKVTDFTITFKMIRRAKSLSAGQAALGQFFQGRGAAQAAQPVNNGSTTGKPGFSFADNLSSMA